MTYPKSIWTVAWKCLMVVVRTHMQEEVAVVVSATILTSYIFKQLKKKVWKKILFVPTGALMSPVSFNEGNSVPGIAHLVQIEAD